MSIHFKTVVQSDVPQGRNGKHKQIVTTILSDLDNLEAASALKVPLAESKEKVHSALNGATRKAARRVETASDAISSTFGTLANSEQHSAVCLTQRSC